MIVNTSTTKEIFFNGKWKSDKTFNRMLLDDCEVVADRNIKFLLDSIHTNSNLKSHDSSHFASQSLGESVLRSILQGKLPISKMFESFQFFVLY